MSTSTTDNLGLIISNPDDPWMNTRVNNNANMTTLDTQIKALQDVITNAKALLGQMGLDENGDPLIDATSARATLGAATDGTNQSSSLYAATQAIAQNASNISSLQDSVSIFKKVGITTRFAPFMWASTSPSFGVFLDASDGQKYSIIIGSTAIRLHDEVTNTDYWNIHNPVVEYAEYTTTCNSTSTVTSWSITGTKSGYYPIGYEVYHGHTTTWVAGAEQINPQLGSITASGYYASTGGADRIIRLKVTWMKIG